MNERSKGRLEMVGFNFFKEGIIEEILVNPYLSDFISSGHSYLLDPVYYRSRSGLVHPLMNSCPPDLRIPTPESFGRTVCTKHGTQIPYADFVGSTIYNKGVGPSGLHFPRFPFSKYRWIENNNPLGFFGDRDAINKEQDISNTLLANGIRSHLVLATVYLNPEALYEQIKKSWHRFDAATAEQIIENAQKVIQNGDQLVQIFRLGSTANRLVFTDEQILAPSIAIGARNWLAEWRLNPEKFSRSYLDGLNQDDLKNVLRNLATYNQISLDQYKLMKRFILNLVGCESEKLVELAKRMPQYSGVLAYYGSPKDTDFSLLACDYEQVQTNHSNLYRNQTPYNLITSAKYYIDYLRDANFVRF